MTQEDIINILKENKNIALSLNEIANKLMGKSNMSAIQKALTQLEKYGEVNAIKVEMRIARKIYGNNIKHGLKLFYV